MAPQDLFGLPLSQAEFTLVIEVAKAALLTLGAAISVLIFNTLAKRREQDTALFNEIVKARITELHSLNGKLVQSIANYLQLLEEMSAYADRPADWHDEKRFRHDEAAIAAIEKYTLSITEREAGLRSEALKCRYDIGESGYHSLTTRIQHLSGRVRHLWQFYQGCLKTWGDELGKTAPHDVPDLRRRSELLIAESVAAEGRRDLIQLVDRIHDDFEKVIRQKGRSTRFSVPVDVDVETGLFRINLFHEGVRHRLGLRLMRSQQVPDGAGGTASP